MGNTYTGQFGFFKDMSKHQISAHEFFSNVLLESLERNFGWKDAIIFYFDPQGRFLSWVKPEGLELDSASHPYRQIISNDVVRYMIYQDAIRDHLTYFNVNPRLYKSSDVIGEIDYNQSAYVRFLEEQFDAHYSATLAFGINGYIQITFLKSAEQGDFVESEMKELEEIYVYVANAYKTFKKYEQSKIISNIQSKVIATGEKAYFVTDDFYHIMECNDIAQEYLEDILGSSIDDQIGNDDCICNWLAFLVEDMGIHSIENMVKTRVIKKYIIKVHTYDQSYSNGIVDRYHWITITHQKEDKNIDFSQKVMPLTPAEQRVAELMYNGLTYKEIADELVVSYHTVKKHVQNIYTKCGVKSRYQLYKWIENTEEA